MRRAPAGRMLALLLLVAPRGGSAEEPALRAQHGAGATVFAVDEVALTFAGAAAPFAALPDDQVHDAYDADRDGVFLRITARFAHADGALLEVPAFALRDAPGGPWRWAVRWAPDRAGAWSMRLLLDGCVRPAGAPVHLEADGGTWTAVADARLDGPLVMPGPHQAPGWLRARRGDGGSAATWLFGACRAWVVDSDPHGPGWAPFEGLDRERQLFPQLRAAGYDLLNQWLAPWEFLLVHQDRAEHWRVAGRWQRTPLPAQAAWRPWACYDQGRAAAFDRLVEACEGAPGERTIRLLLTPLPHGCMTAAGQPWGAQAPADAPGFRAPEQRCGLSALPGLEECWDYFAADPRAPAEDWRAQLFDWQAAHLRYVVARWGASRAIGLWVLADEIDAVGDELGVMRAGRGWWGHPDCARWLADQVALLRGTLLRPDGLRYGGDPWRHPLHASTTSSGTGADADGNLAWDGGPPGGRVDVVGWHWYPSWSRGAGIDDAWGLTIDGIAAFAQAPGAGPRLISEFGAVERATPEAAPSPLYPTLYHHGIWAAVFSGLAGTVMDWDDGKEFGELRWRAGGGPFGAEQYPLDNGAQLTALRAVLAGIAPDALVPCSAPLGRIRCQGGAGVRALALAHAGVGADGDALHGWAFAPQRRGEAVLSGLRPGAYLLTWFDPWRGTALGPAQPLSVPASGTVRLQLLPILRLLGEAAVFPQGTRSDRGKDVAFRLVAVP